MENIEILKKIGLNEKEASVYLALLELGTATVHPIAAKAGIKRPTTYLILDQLQHKGMVSIIPRAKKALYTAESPEKLISDLKKKEELLKGSLPNLLALFNARKEKPQVQLFEGIEGVKQVYEKIYAAAEVLFFGTPSEILKIDPDALRSFVKRVREGNLKVRDMMADIPAHREYVNWAKAEKKYEIRYLPKGESFFTDSAIFGDSVVFFSFRPMIFGVMITSSDISKSLRTLYEMAWRLAVPITKTSP